MPSTTEVAARDPYFLLILQHPNTPRPFTGDTDDFYNACTFLQIELDFHNSFGCTPSYWYHPAYEIIVEMVDILCARDTCPVELFKEINDSWDMDLDEDGERCEEAIIRILQFLKDTYHQDRQERFSRLCISPSVPPTAGSENFQPPDVHLESGPEAFVRAPFSTRQFFLASRALEEEMDSHGCFDPFPLYSPSPAFDAAYSYFEQLWELGISPSAFFYQGMLSEHQVTFGTEELYETTRKAGWYAKRWCFAKEKPMFLDYADMAHWFFYPAPDDLSEAEDVPATKEARAAAVIDTLEPLVLSSDSDHAGCPICLEKYVVADDATMGTGQEYCHTAVKTPCCRQPFGKDCLFTVLLECGDLCPLCRGNLVDIAMASV